MDESTNKPSVSTGTYRFEVGRDFAVGGVVAAERSLYLQRPADDELFRLAMAGEFAHVFAARGSGKSSLTARVAERLREEERQVAVIDLEQIGSRDERQDVGRWFYSFAFRLLRQLRIKTDLQDWWQDKANLTNRQRLTELFWDLVLSNTEQPVTVFIDSPRSFDALPFAEELLGAIDALHTARAAEPELARLNFVLLAVAEPVRLGNRAGIQFFASSHRVELAPFTRHELEPLADRLAPDRPRADELLDRIHYWTGGQPFLTMKLARHVARQNATSDGPGADVDDSVKQLFGHATVLDNEPHLGVIQRAMLFEVPDRDLVLTLYGRVRKGDRVLYNAENLVHRRLLDEGVLKVADDGHLVVANRIYAYALTSRWANEHLPVRIQTTLLAAVIVMLALLVPLWYVELLPRQWVSTLQSPPVLADATEAHERMRAWPGHRQTANRLLADYLRRRSLAATDVAEAREFDRLLRELPGTDASADELLALFWDRQALTYELAADRDAALEARLLALHATGDATPPERWQAADALISSDYAQLVGMARLAVPVDDAALTADAQAVIALSGATVRQLALGAGTDTPADVWDATALSVFPVLSRLPVAATGRTARFNLTVNLAHDRVTDLRFRLTAPSGRSALLSGSDATPVAGGQIQFSSSVLPSLGVLENEAVNGGWTLSIVDQTPVIAGTFDGWSLDFARHGRVETEPTSMLLREPEVARVSRAVLSPRARYVVALPDESSGVAQVWESATRQAVATLPVGPTDRVIGFVLDERVLLVARPQGLAAWALATGDSSWAPPLETALLSSALSLNRQFVAAVGAGTDAEIVVFDLIEEREVARLPVAAELAAIAVANHGELVAVAYADQTVRLWRIGSDAPIAEVSMPGVITALDFAADSQRLYVRTAAGTLSIWAFTDTAVPLEHRASELPWELDPGSAGNRLVLGNAASGFQVFDAASLDARSPLIRTGSVATAYRARYRGAHDSLLLYSPDDGIVKVFRVARADLPDTATAGPIPLARISADGQRLVVADRPGEIRVVPVSADGLPRATGVGFIGHSASIDVIRFGPDGELVATAANDGSVRVWDSAQSAPRTYFIRPGWTEMADMSFSQDGARLALAAAGGVAVYDTANGALIGRREFAEPVTAVVFGPGNDELLVGHATGTVSLVTISSGFVGEQIYAAADEIVAVTTSRRAFVIADRAGNVAIGRRGSPVLWRQRQTGEACRELVASADGSAVVCRTANWLYRFALMAADAQSAATARLQPPQSFFDGMALDLAAERVTLLARNRMVGAVTVDFGAGSVTAPERLSSGELDAWLARLSRTAAGGPFAAEEP